MAQVEDAEAAAPEADTIVWPSVVEVVAIDDDSSIGGGAYGTTTAVPNHVAVTRDDESTPTPTPSPPLYLIRNVRTRKFLDAASAASATTEPSGIYLQPRNGQPTQLFSFVDGRIVNSSSAGNPSRNQQQEQRWLLAAEWSLERQAYSRAVGWVPASRVRDAADAVWDLTADGTILHRATGQVLGLGLNSVGWRGVKLHLYPPAPHNDLQQFQLLPIDLVK